MARWLAFTVNRLCRFAAPKSFIVEHEDARFSQFGQFSQWVSLRFNGPTRRSLIFLSSRHMSLFSIPYFHIIPIISLHAGIFSFSCTSGTRSFGFIWLFVQSCPKQYRGPIFSMTNGEAKNAAFHVGRGASSTLLLWYRRILAVARPFASSAFPRLCNARARARLTWPSTRGPRSTYETVRNPILPSVPRYGERYEATVFPRRSCAPRSASGNRTGKGQKGPVTR